MYDIYVPRDAVTQCTKCTIEAIKYLPVVAACQQVALGNSAPASDPSTHSVNA